MEQRIRQWLDDQLPYKATSSNVAVDIAAALDTTLQDAITALASLERRKIYKHTYFKTAITRVSKGAEFKALPPGVDSRPRSIYGLMLGELRKIATNGSRSLKKPAVYLSGRIHGLSVAQADEALCRLHDAAVISVFRRTTGEADILVGDHTEAIDSEVHELIGDCLAKEIPSGDIYVLVERLLTDLEATNESLDDLHKQAADGEQKAKEQSERITQLEDERAELQRVNSELNQAQHPSNRQRKEMRRLGLLE
jgi:hypothetical protein